MPMPIRWGRIGVLVDGQAGLCMGGCMSRCMGLVHGWCCWVYEKVMLDWWGWTWALGEVWLVMVGR